MPRPRAPPSQAGTEGSHPHRRPCAGMREGETCPCFSPSNTSGPQRRVCRRARRLLLCSSVSGSAAMSDYHPLFCCFCIPLHPASRPARELKAAAAAFRLRPLRLRARRSAPHHAPPRSPAGVAPRHSPPGPDEAEPPPAVTILCRATMRQRSTRTCAKAAHPSRPAAPSAPSPAAASPAATLPASSVAAYAAAAVDSASLLRRRSDPSRPPC